MNTSSLSSIRTADHTVRNSVATGEMQFSTWSRHTTNHRNGAGDRQRQFQISAHCQRSVCAERRGAVRKRLAYSMPIWTMSSCSLPGYGSATQHTRACMQLVQNQSRYGSSALKVAGASILAVEQRCRLVQTLQQQSQNSTTLLRRFRLATHLARRTAEMEKLRQLMLTDITSKASIRHSRRHREADGDMNDTSSRSYRSNTDSRTYSRFHSSSTGD